MATNQQRIIKCLDSNVKDYTGRGAGVINEIVMMIYWQNRVLNPPTCSLSRNKLNTLQRSNVAYSSSSFERAKRESRIQQCGGRTPDFNTTNIRSLSQSLHSSPISSFKICFNIILPFALRSSNTLHCKWFYYRTSTSIFCSPATPPELMTNSSHIYRFCCPKQSVISWVCNLINL